MKHLAALLCCFLFLGCDGLKIESASSKYKGVPEFEQLKAGTAALAGELYYHDLSDVLGLSTAGTTPSAVIRFEDLPLELYEASPEKARTEWLIGRPTIVFHTELLMNGRTNFRQTLLHEMIHAVMSSRVPVLNYGLLPKWVREGAATYGAGQANEQLNLALLEALDQVGWDLDRLEDVPFRFSKHHQIYTEGALIFEYLDRFTVKGAFRQFIGLVLKGYHYKDAIAKLAAPLSYNEVMTYARGYAQQRVRDKLDELPTSVVQGLALCARGRYREALPVLTPGLPYKSGKFYEGYALFKTATAFAYSEQQTRALPILKHLLAHYASADILHRRGELQSLLAATYYKLGKLALAGKHYELVLRDFPNQQLLVQSVDVQLGEVYNRMGEHAKAIRLLNQAHLNGAWSDAVILLERGRAYKGLGDRKHAVASFRKVLMLKKAPVRLKEQAEQELGR